MIYEKLAELIKPGSTIIEIGAHVGTDTKKLSTLLKPSTHLAIEPDVRNIEKLKMVCDTHGVTLVECAVGSTPGITPFWYSSVPDCNSLRKPINTPSRPVNTTFKLGSVHCETLDSIKQWYGLRHVNLIWMDVQGAEIDVLRCAPRTLSVTDYIYTECQIGRYEGQPGLNGILSLLRGWSVIMRNGDNVLLELE